MKTSIWSHRPGIEQFAEFTRDTMVNHIGIRITEVTNDSLSAEMPVDHRTCQPYGILHGGASAALAETLGSFASQMCIKDPVNGKVVGIELNINHLGQARSGVVTGVATPVKLGRTLHVWQIDIHDDAGKYISRARLTVLVLSQDGYP